jgi:hypothetical protein
MGRCQKKNSHTLSPCCFAFHLAGTRVPMAEARDVAKRKVLLRTLFKVRRRRFIARSFSP